MIDKLPQEYVLTPDVVKKAGHYHDIIKESIDTIFEKDLNDKDWTDDFNILKQQMTDLSNDKYIDRHIKMNYKTTISKIIQIIRLRDYDTGANYKK